jgi:hypothetical protein
VATFTAEIQWGDVATWVGGIATAAALFLTYRLLRITRREQRTLQVEKRQAQARLVSAWTSQVQPTSGSSVSSITVTLQNSSHEPVYGLRVAVGSRWAERQITYDELDLLYIMPPKSQQEIETVLQLADARNGEVESTLPVELLFSDAAGRYWHRNQQGGLTEITKGLPPSGGDYFFKSITNTNQPA